MNQAPQHVKYKSQVNVTVQQYWCYMFTFNLAGIGYHNNMIFKILNINILLLRK